MSSRPRAYRRARAQSTLHHLTLLPYCTGRPLIFLPFQERMSLHVTRTLEQSVIYCVACFLSSYLLASEQMQRAPRHICSSTKLHMYVQLKHGEESYSENRRKAPCAPNLSKNLRAFTTHSIFRENCMHSRNIFSTFHGSFE